MDTLLDHVAKFMTQPLPPIFGYVLAGLLLAMVAISSIASIVRKFS